MTRARFAFLLGGGLLELSLSPVHAGVMAATNQTVIGAPHIDCIAIVLAQAEVRIPSDAQLERMEERAITTNPLDDSEASGFRGGDAAENRQMDRRAHRIDEQLLKDDGVCSGC